MIKSVLVVEDEVGVRRALGRLLADKGFRTIEAGNGREAIQRLTEETPAAIVIDLLMPIMSGAELLKALRRNSFYRRIPTVVMTGALESQMPADVAEVLGVPVVFKPNVEGLPDLLVSLIASANSARAASSAAVVAVANAAASVRANSDTAVANDVDSAS